jgi:pimeloyl-ACP methyl ester carboxylesterase
MTKRLARGAVCALTLVTAMAINVAPSGAVGAATHCRAARRLIGSVEAVVPGGIDVQEAVEIGGVKQWISIRGNNRKNPILLFLHGGPGSPMSGESWAFQRPWEDFFTVVQWDQRGSGKTFSLDGRKVDRSMTIRGMAKDAEDLVGWLRRSYGNKKIFLLGHSWGSILGVMVAQDHPEWLYAYVGVGQVVNMRKNEALGYQLTLDEARSSHNSAAVKALEGIAPYPNADGSIPESKTSIERKWDVAFGGMLYGHSKDDELGRWSLSPYYSSYDVESARLGEDSTTRILWSQLASVDFDSITAFKCPVIIFAGAQDRTTPAGLAEQYYQRIRAPQKRLIVVQGAAHYVFMERPGEFLLDLMRYVRPLAGLEKQQ